MDTPTLRPADAVLEDADNSLVKILIHRLAALLIVSCLAGCFLKDKPPNEEAAAASVPTTKATPPPVPTPKPAAKAKPNLSVLAYIWPPNWFGMLFPKKPAPPQALPPQVIGVVKMVNAADGFVLIDAVSFAGTEPGTQLICIANQKETAILRMSTLKTPPFLIADIASGHPSPGDKVFKP